jgi:hypothetical protein
MHNSTPRKCLGFETPVQLLCSGSVSISGFHLAGALHFNPDSASPRLSYTELLENKQNNEKMT